MLDIDRASSIYFFYRNELFKVRHDAKRLLRLDNILYVLNIIQLILFIFILSPLCFLFAKNQRGSKVGWKFSSRFQLKQTCLKIVPVFIDQFFQFDQSCDL